MAPDSMMAVPVTAIRELLVGFNSMVVTLLLSKFKVPTIFKVPIELPGVRFPKTVTFPLIVPDPFNVAAD